MGRFSGRVAMVTGSASGMGREIALCLAEEGCRVVACDIAEEQGEAVAAACRERGSEAVFVQTDVGDETQVAAAVKLAVAQFGGLDLACNNAGIEGPIANVADLEMADWQRVLQTDLTGVWLGMKHQIRQFRVQGRGGSIVNTASIMSYVANPGIAAYTAAKHGVVGLTKTAALEYAAEGIRVNAICPGGIRTAIIERTEQTHPEKIDGLIAATPMQRLGQPLDIANATLWLLSEEANYITGQSLVIDGGFICQ